MSWRKLLADVGGAVFGTNQFGLHPAAPKGIVYPLDLEFTLADEQTYYAWKDGAGIPVRRYRSVGEQYNPTRIAAYGLAHFNRFITSGNEESRRHFLNMAEWFLRAEDGLWRYEFDWPGLKAPWISGMAQGEGISVLTRAFHLTQEERYLAQARKAALPFTREIAAGGVRSRIDDRHPFLEEYPLAAPAHTLNGFLYALMGILDLMSIDAGSEEEMGFRELVETLEGQWPRWDLGYWSAYDLHVAEQGLRNAATVTYHRLHVSQLRYLARRLESEPLAACAEHWAACYRSPRNRLRALSAKIHYRLKEPAPQ